MKTLFFVGSSQKDIQDFPEDVKDDIGYALYQVQQGIMPISVKPLKGFAGGVLEAIEDYRGGAYRAVYTVRFQGVIYVLHCFQKKSKRGVKTPQRDMNLIQQRLKLAEGYYKANARQ